MGNQYKVTQTSSRSEEMAFLQSMVDQVEDGSYMSMLLTPELVRWTENKIECDFPPDVFAEINTVVNQREELKKENESLKRENEDLAPMEMKIHELSRVIDELKDELSQKGQKLILAEKETEEKQKEIIKMKAKLYDLLVTDK